MDAYYEDGTVAIYHGDCREVIPALDLFGGSTACIMDPPYGIAYRSNMSPETRTHSARIVGDATTDLRDFALGALDDMPTACFATWRCAPPRPPRTCLVWDKGPGIGMGDLSLPWKPNFELVWIFGDGWAGSYRGSSVLGGRTQLASTAAQGRLHPHQKPVWLLGALIDWAPKRTILDPFMGSGTTLQAAKDRGRRAIGIEVEERYCEIAAERARQEVLAL